MRVAIVSDVHGNAIALETVIVQFVRRAGGTLWVNPGSIGLSYDHEQPEDDFRFDPWGAYGLVAADDDGRLSVELRRVPVDVDAIVARVESCGMPGAAEGAWRWRPRAAG